MELVNPFTGFLVGLLVGFTDIAHAIPLARVAGLDHLMLGNIDLHLLGTLLIGSIPGVMLGALLSHKASGQWVRNSIAATLLIVGGKPLLQP